MTLIFLAISAGLCAFNAYAPGLWSDDDGALYVGILAMAISMILYRFRKWKMRTPRRGRSAKLISGRRAAVRRPGAPSRTASVAPRPRPGSKICGQCRGVASRTGATAG